MRFLAKIVNGLLHIQRIYQKIAPYGVHSMAFWKIAVLKTSEILKKTHVLDSFLKISGCSVANRKRLCQELFPRLCQQVLRAIILKNNSSAVTSHRKIENWLRIWIIPETWEICLSYGYMELQHECIIAPWWLQPVEISLSCNLYHKIKHN